ncbi:MAG: 3-phosphoshikimate 1-carboxyvinyltransferase [Deltaproteobacteria bacterium]|nr:3-phosphoshikimate 1-carboxyvinyltransferase [Deltaproteobacteria bacterium]
MNGNPSHLFALFGNPVGHSLSPAMHNIALKEMGINGLYVPIQVEHLEAAVEGIRGMGIRGVSVTIPFKTKIMTYLDAVDREARRIGAVNTVVNRKGRLTGCNTDWLGIVKALSGVMKINGKTVMIVGAGGTARAALFGILKEGGKPFIVNRTAQKGRRLAKEWGCPFFQMKDVMTFKVDCLINTTPVGMSPNTGEPPVPPEILRHFGVVMDVIYNPLKTQLLVDAEKAGCIILPGLDMFIHQGAEQLKLWTGLEPPRGLMTQVVRDALTWDHGKTTRIELVDHAASTVRVPGSKSYTQRAFICAALARGKSKLRNVLASEDTDYFMSGLSALGARIQKKGDNLFIEGTGGRIAHPGKEIFLGNNGTALRFFTSLVALGKGRYELTGTARLCDRPVGALLKALNTLGVNGYSRRRNDCPPVIVEADGLPGGCVTMKNVESSQFVSSLLFSAPYAHQDVTVTLEGNTVSRPYIAMTLQVMNDFGAEARRQGENTYLVKSGRPYEGRDYLIEGDASSASYFILAAALTRRRIKILNVNPESLQGDMKFVDIIEKLGCTVTRGDEWIEVEGKPLAEGNCIFPMADMPDMVPTLAVLAAFRKGQTVITDSAHLRIKESDRLTAVVSELCRVGIAAEETADGMIIQGGIPHGAVIETYSDHRIAMSFAVAGLVAPGIEIADRECVGKSFPGFWDELKKL